VIGFIFDLSVFSAYNFVAPALALDVSDFVSIFLAGVDSKRLASCVWGPLEALASFRQSDPRQQLLRCDRHRCISGFV
jgi:hypothetical protein